MLFTEARITCSKHYAEKSYIRETAQAQSAELLLAALTTACDQSKKKLTHYL